MVSPVSTSDVNANVFSQFYSAAPTQETPTSGQPLDKTAVLDQATYGFVTKLLRQANEVSEAILYPVPNKHTSRHRTTWVVSGGGRRQNLIIIGLYSLVFGISRLVHYTKRNENLEGKMKNFNSTVQNWDKNVGAFVGVPEYRNSIEEVIDLTNTILYRHKNHLTKIISSLALTILAGTLLITSGVVASVALALAGGSLLLTAASYSVYLQVQHSIAKENDTKDAVALSLAVNKIYDDSIHQKFKSQWS